MGEDGNKKYRLSDDEKAVIEGIRNQTLNSTNNRFRLKKEEVDVVLKFRAIKEHSEAMGLDPSTVKDGWLKTKEASIRFVNPEFGGVSVEQIKSELIEAAKNHAPIYAEIKRPKPKTPHLMLLSVADLHIGKYSSKASSDDEYDSGIAVLKAVEAITELIDKVSGYEIDEILLPVSNDVLHVDGPNNTTTKGTRQDVSGLWHENFILARKFYVSVIEMLLSIADVHVCHVPSNHDYALGFCLTDAINCWFNKCKNVTFDGDMKHRKYFQYNNNLIGLTHGDGARETDLPLLMANECKDGWAKTEYRYFFCGHLHHYRKTKLQSGKDYQGVTVEHLRTLSPADEYHHKHGYIGAKRAIEAFIHHPVEGQIAKIIQHT
jgi:hypothetical protein